MTRKTYLFIVALVILGIGQVSGIPSTGWGSVDTRLLLVLHPEMRNYDYIYNRFFRKDISSKTSFDIAKDLEKGREGFQPELDRLQMKRSDLVRRREAVYYDKENRIHALLNPDKAESAILRGRVDHAKKSFAFLNKERNPNESSQEEQKAVSLSIETKNNLINEIEKNTSGEIQKVQKEIDKIDKEIYQVGEKMYSEVYLTPSETMDRFLTIKGEIQELIASAAAENNIGAVIDSSFGMRPVKKPDDLLFYPIHPDSPDVLSSAIFSNFANWDPPKGGSLGSGTNSTLSDHIFPAILAQKVGDLKKYLELRNYVNEQAPLTPGKFFLIGGKDITILVAKKLFAKYRLPEPVKNAFLGVIGEYISFEKANFQR